MTAPRPGDRVRVVVEGTVPSKAVGGSLLSLSVLLDPTIISEEVITPAESSHSGDVVRNAVDADDRRTWVYLPTDPFSAVCWYQISGPGIGRRSTRGDLPDRLELLVRDGRRVLPEPTDKDIQTALRAGGLGSDYALRDAVNVLDERRGVIRP